MEEDLARWAELLTTSLQVSGLTEDELERRLGWSPGALGQFLNGEDGLKPDQALEILVELYGRSRLAGRDETSAYGDDRSQMVTDLLDRFRVLGYEPRAALSAIAASAPPTAGPSDPGELEKKVESVLRRAYGEPRDDSG